MRPSPRALKLIAGLASVAASAYLYLLYQQLETLLPGALSIAMFAAGSYIVLREVSWLKQFGRVLPFIVAGASASIALVVMGISSDIADSYYAAAMSLLSAKLTAFLFALAGMRVRVSGDVLSLPNGTALAVGPLCSGAYSTVLFMLLSVVMVADLGRTAPRKRLLAAVAVGLIGANLANVFRITFLASVMYYFGPGVLGVVHQFAGYAVFLGFMAAFWTVSLRWLGSGHHHGAGAARSGNSIA